ncbi:MAG: cyclic pyranopterin phosphate synthase MoaA [Deltaproteobacteria bacterium SG8_13]|nr:MAG: cyclic pyranopterin phosphate synthase MoaA [Deltaproteobacteria bacterium SG8_13]
MNERKNTKLIDRHDRRLNYLRISVTDRCNLRCTYCVPPDRIPWLSHAEILRYEEILRIVRVGVDLGITKIRVTGGEPLVRKGVIEFLESLSEIPGISELTLTTNGVYLEEHAERIRAAGIRRLNISLDTLRPEKFARITGSDVYDRVWQGIESAVQQGFDPIKINVVALRGMNDDELVDFSRLTLRYPYHVRFIEHMPIGKSRVTATPPLLVPEIKARIRPLGELLPVEKNADDGPAERFRFKGAPGEIGFISALSHHFCSSCNRLRLTASGQLRPCLLSDRQLDLKALMRAGCDDRQLAQIFQQAVRNKPSDHNLAVNDPTGVSCQMSSIGG